MATLREQLRGGSNRREVIEDACHVLDQEVADQRGIGGMAVKGAYKVVKGVKPGFVREVVENLLDDFVDALDPIYQEALAAGQPPGRYLSSHSSQMADALLSITDARAKRAKNATIKVLYEKLRPSAKKHVEAAAPRLGQMLERHAPLTRD
jgi:hypothetical protein